MRILVLSLIFSVSLDAHPPTTLEEFFGHADAFFKTYTQDGLVDYAAIVADRTELEELTSFIAEADLTDATKSEKLAFYINTYNILVIEGMVEKSSVRSPLKTSSFFDRKIHSLSGQKVSLNQLENQIIRPEFKDARVHFVLVCGALGCPPITEFAYVPKSLDVQLEQQTAKALNDPGFIKVRDDKVMISQIFEWYAEDFGTGKAAILKYINGYRKTKLPSKPKLSYYQYDWSPNAVTGS